MSDGLEDVVAANTVLSEVDGQRGQLIIRGHSLDELAGRARFEDVARILFDGFFDDLPNGVAGPRQQEWHLRQVGHGDRAILGHRRQEIR